MSPIAVGIDLVDVDDVRDSVRRFGSRYLERIYTAGEIAYADSSPGERAERLAARFAAKEAVIKLLRPDDEAVPWRDVEVLRSRSGACEVRLTGAALRLARRSGIGDVALSLTHQGRSAAAVAAALTTVPRRKRPARPASPSRDFDTRRTRK